ncbi:hypothetical protein FSP39_005509 [Pinctada imbricata]|uniref:DNA-(apurinic or apyrimidinic site) endonuclease n=1 Tax=Pinctada imbricata TaxID=66713 RepID=A0AA89BZZ0_PINIB|nr:hypothetical protein FSP39_005509 [Pinctada imbricata]
MVATGELCCHSDKSGFLFQAAKGKGKSDEETVSKKAKVEDEPAEEVNRGYFTVNIIKPHREVEWQILKPKKPKKGKGKGKAAAKPKKEASVESLPDDADTSFPTEVNPDCKTPDGRKPTIKIASWNVNGIRAWSEKDKMKYLNEVKPDILCIQETKCKENEIPDSVKHKDYKNYWSSAEQAGYAGTGLYTKQKPINVTYGLGIKKHDDEGRVITAEYDKFFLVTAYVPNAGKGLVRLNYRHKEWDVAFTDHLKKLDAKKPVIMCGDLNVAHKEIDLKNPKSNKNKTAGFTDQERQGFTDLLDAGFVDSFRFLYPNARECWSFWSYMMNARAKNIGWRLDYFVISERLKADLCDSIIQQSYMGSDHCPIMLLMSFK